MDEDEHDRARSNLHNYRACENVLDVPVQNHVQPPDKRVGLDSTIQPEDPNSVVRNEQCDGVRKRPVRPAAIGSEICPFEHSRPSNRIRKFDEEKVSENDQGRRRTYRIYAARAGNYSL